MLGRKIRDPTPFRNVTLYHCRLALLCFSLPIQTTPNLTYFFDNTGKIKYLVNNYKLFGYF